MWSKEKIKQFCAALRDCSHYSNLDEEDIEEVLDLVEYLQNEVERLREGIECHIARPGEGTYECNVAKPCPACRLRSLNEHS